MLHECVDRLQKFKLLIINNLKTTFIQACRIFMIFLDKPERFFLNFNDFATFLLAIFYNSH